MARDDQPRKKRTVVDEPREKIVQFVDNTIIFRPGQILDGKMLSVAREYGVQTREL